jgi:hypothetical protein
VAPRSNPAKREHGPRLALAADPASRFAGLLRVATKEIPL